VGPSVDRFYTIARAAYDAFDPTTNDAPSPPEADRFPAQTDDLAVYYAVDGADAAHRTSQLTLSDTSGVLIRYHSHVLDHDKIGIADDIGPQQALPNGTYRLDLRLDGKAASSHTFTVGP